MRVTMHFAQSLDGRIAYAPPSDRLLLSSPEGFALAHRLRAEHDAVLVGIRTVLRDDPRLTVRACRGPQPRRVVLDSALRIPERARLLDGESGRALVCGARGRADDAAASRLRARGVDVCVLPASSDGRVSLRALLCALAERNVRRLLVEGGATVISSFVRERIVDRLSVEIAPTLLGPRALAAFEGLAGGAVRLDDVRVERLGTSVLVQGQVAYDDDRAAEADRAHDGPYGTA